MDKLQFIVLIFAVLLSKLCNVLLCKYKVYLSSFSILQMAAICHIRLSKIKSLNFTSGAGDQHTSPCQFNTNRSNSCRDMAI